MWFFMQLHTVFNLDLQIVCLFIYLFKEVDNAHAQLFYITFFCIT